MRNDVSTKEMYTQTALVNICIGEAVEVVSVELKDDKKPPGVAGIPIKLSVYKTSLGATLKGFTKVYYI